MFFRSYKWWSENRTEKSLLVVQNVRYSDESSIQVFSIQIITVVKMKYLILETSTTNLLSKWYLPFKIVDLMVRYLKGHLIT